MQIKHQFDELEKFMYPDHMLVSKTPTLHPLLPVKMFTLRP